MKCSIDVFLTLAGVGHYCLPTKNLVSASFRTKIGKNDVVNAHAQSKVVQLFDVCKYSFSQFCHAKDTFAKEALKIV